MSLVVRRCRGCAREYPNANQARCEDCGYEVGWWCPAHEQWLAWPRKRSWLARLLFKAPDRPTCEPCKRDAREARKAARAARAAGRRRRRHTARTAKTLTAEGLKRRSRLMRLVLWLIATAGLVAGLVAVSYFVALAVIEDNTPPPRITSPAAVAVDTRPPIDPAEIANWLKLAGTAMEARYYPRARELFEKVIASDPENAWAHCGIAGAYHGLRRETEAIAAAREALRLGGDDKLLAASHYALGRSLAAMRKRREAIQELRACLKLNRRHTTARRLLNRLSRRRTAR